MNDFIMDDIEIEDDEEYVITDPQIYVERARTLLNMRYFEVAMKEAEQAIAYGKGEPQYLILKLRVLYESTQFEQALKYIKDSRLFEIIKGNCDLLDDERNYPYMVFAKCAKEIIADKKNNKVIINTKDCYKYVLTPSEVYHLGCMFRSGKGFSRNDQRAVSMFQVATNNGNVDATASLAYMYQMGRGVLKNNNMAVDYYTKAAKQGNVGAQYNLGVMFLNGNGIGQDYERAAYWLFQASEKGDADALYQIGRMHYKGMRFQKNTSKGIELISRAKQRGSKAAERFLNNYYEQEEKNR